MNEPLLQQAIANLRAGRRQEARRQLLAIIDQDPHNAKAWLIMGAAVEDPYRRRQCYEMVLQIEPGNQIALAALIRLDQQQTGATPSPIAENPTSPSITASQTTTPQDLPTNAATAAIPNAAAPSLPVAIKSRLSRNQRTLLTTGAILLLLFLCTCYAVSTLFSALTDRNQLVEESDQPAPIRAIPATYTPRSSGIVTGAENNNSACRGQASAYLDRISPIIVEFSELVQLRSVVSTDVELAAVVVALEEPYDDFRAITPPACVTGYANQIEKGMEEVIKTMLDYTINTISRDQAHDGINAGLIQIRDALEAMDRLSDG